MRVLDTTTGQFEEINPRDPKIKYSTLSHTWDAEGEQTYQELRDIQKRQPHGSIWDDAELSPKVREACRVARQNGYRFLWIDSCCIDKTSSPELSESINSMYQWYAHGDICYAFLAKVPAKEDHKAKDSRFRRSRWFRRGWTLQELIAPLDLVFLAQDWTVIGSKLSLAGLVTEITNIDYDALLHVEPLDEFSVAQRLSWAATRETTRVEDRAYSLLGIFDINMPTLYGEGERAFRRLQEEIMRRTPDQSIFAWAEEGLPDASSNLHDHKIVQPAKYHRRFLFGNLYPTLPSLLAPSLGAFSKCAGIEALSHDEVIRRLQLPTNSLPVTDYDVTPHGIRLQLPVIPFSSSNYFPPECVDEQRMDIPLSRWYLVILECGHKDFPGHLLRRVCYTRSLGSSIESLYSGGILWPGETQYIDVLPVSPTSITRIKSHISSRTLYIPQPRRNLEGANEAARWKPHEMVSLVLSKKTREALSAHGYAATLRGPDDAHPTTHLVTLAHNTHTITIRYQHTLREPYKGGQKVTVHAYVKTSGPIPQAAPRDDLGVPQVNGDRTYWVAWTDELPWFERLGANDVELIMPGPMKLTVRLDLAFATRNHYLLRIELWTPANGPSPHSAPVPPIERKSGTGCRSIP